MAYIGFSDCIHMKAGFVSEPIEILKEKVVVVVIKIVFDAWVQELGIFFNKAICKIKALK